MVNNRADYALIAEYFLEVAVGAGRFIAWVLAEGHGWKEAVFVYRAAAPVGVFSRGKTRISGSLSCGTREVRSLCAW